MNSFDAFVYALLAVAVVTGFSTGLLRSMATIFAYVAAMPIALAATPLIAPAVAGRLSPSFAQSSLLFAGVFLATGVVLGGLLRLAVSELVGPTVSFPDRLAGSMLGGARIALVAVTIVLIFDQVIPPDHEPDFLIGSRLRPILSVAGRAGLKSLPPDVTQLIDRLKHVHRISYDAS